MRSGWPVNVDAEEVEDLALGEAHARVEVGEARDRRVVGRAPAQIARMRRLRGCERKLATTSNRSAATPGGTHALGVDEVVDGGDVDALRELLLVAQERGDVVPVARGRT